MTDYRRFFSRAAAQHDRSRRSAGWATSRRRVATSSRSRPAIRRPTRSPGTSSRRSPHELLSGRDGSRAAVRADARLRSRCSRRSPASWRGAARRRAGIACSSRPDRSRASTWSRASCSIRATSSSSSCRPTPARSPRSATRRRNWSASAGRRRHRPRRARRRPGVRLQREGRRVARAVRRAELPESDRPADRPRQAGSAARVGRAPRRAASSKTIRIATCTSRTRRPRPTSGRSAPTIATGRVVYLSSFSKTLAPGYRVAWIDAPPPLAAKLEIAKQASDLCTGELDQRIVYEACRRGILDRQAADAARALSGEARRDGRGAAARARRRDQLAGSARRLLPVGDAAGRHRRATR